MATITLVDGDVYFTTAPESDISTTEITNSQNYISVRVVSENFETLINSAPIVFERPVSAQRQPSRNAANPNIPTADEIDAANVVNIVDLYKIKTSYNVQGRLIEEDSETGATKAANLKILSKVGGTIRMVYRDNTEQVVEEGIVMKMSIKERPIGRVTSESSIAAGNPIAYEVQVAFMRGTNRNA